MKSKLLAMALVVCAAACCAASQDPVPEEPAGKIELFNGKDFTHWYKFIEGRGKNCDPKGVFSVVDGKIRVSGEEWGCITTEKAYKNYKLTVEYRWSGGEYGEQIGKSPDSGILYHSIGEDGAWRGIWMRCLEYNVIKSRTGDLLLVESPEYVKNSPFECSGYADSQGRWQHDPDEQKEEAIVHLKGGGRINNRFRPPMPQGGFKHSTPEVFPENKEGEWNKCVLICDGDKVEHIFNGVTVVRAWNVKPTGGRIQLQSEGHGVEFRRVTIEPLPAKETKVSPPRFKPFEIPGLEKRPDFWKVRTGEIVDICEKAKKCARKEIICRTPSGHPVYALFYGDGFDDTPPQSNWSAGGSSTTYKNYMGNPPPAKQTFLLLAGVHGAEPECVAGAVNLIQALETGMDFRGKEHGELLDLISKYRFIIVPCLNMDGRSISPDHLRGVKWTTFREVSQGVWKDGSRIGWRGSKSWFPLPLDRVSFPGGYPNSEGYNIMHDATPGDIRTEEARAVLKLASRWRVDAVLNGHSYESAPSVIRHSSVDLPSNAARNGEIAARINAAIHASGLRNPAIPRYTEGSPRINLNTMLAMASGALALTLECSVSYDRADRPELKPPRRLYTFDELMEPLFIAVREYLKDGLEKPFLVRGTDKVYND